MNIYKFLLSTAIILTVEDNPTKLIIGNTSNIPIHIYDRTSTSTGSCTIDDYIISRRIEAIRRRHAGKSCFQNSLQQPKMIITLALTIRTGRISRNKIIKETCSFEAHQSSPPITGLLPAASSAV